MPERLGPLELVGGRWVIGDATRGTSSWLVLTAEGMEHHSSWAPEPRAVVPWSRFVELDVWAGQWAWMATRMMGVIGTGSTMVGRDACSVRALVRHPYDTWSAHYTHHKRSCTFRHIGLVDALFAETTKAKAAHRLGDPEWLSEAVARLRALEGRGATERPGGVSELIRELGV
ncbi:hypothetical protein AB0B50_25745 [Streptomyces sp. NPDC041068]|uniref:hypothetical protein n=1 Tax=Streptomyces sp. NPDC041068 TaxID=3155130 RepID=UPI0033E29C93